MSDTPGGASGAGQFSTLDSDHDGRVSMTEFMASASHMPSGGASSSGSSSTGSGATSGSTGTSGTTGGSSSSPSGSTGSGMSGTGSSSMSGADTTKLFKSLDTNHDGYLSQAELTAYQSSKGKSSNK